MAAFDPEAPLPGAPDLWAGSEMPALRDGPPYAMTEMIAAEPALAERLIKRLAKDPVLGQVAVLLRGAATQGRPMITTGCGTSEHAAMVAAALLTDALDGTTAWPIQALEAARRPPANGVLLAVSLGFRDDPLCPRCASFALGRERAGLSFCDRGGRG